MTLLPRSGVAELPAYIPGEVEVEDVDRVIKLSSNESPLGASSRALEALKIINSEANLYPDANAVTLREALASHHDLEPGQLLCTCGSEEALHLAARAYVDTGDEVIISQYGFIGHRIAAQSAGATLVVAPESNYRVDLVAIRERVSESTRIIYIANPGNPTGTWVPFQDIKEFHADLPENTLLVLDAAYAEFADQQNKYESGISLIREGAENVMVTRTFSKLYGLAGLRIGWAYCSPDVAAFINRVRPAFNANGFGQAAAIAALGDDEFVRTALSVNNEGLETLTSGLEMLGINVTPSVCNFVLAHFEDLPSVDAGSVFEALKQQGVIVRPVGGYGLPHSLRVSVGTPEENGIFLRCMEKVLGSGGT